MTREVNCRKYNHSLEGLATPPFPGPIGQAIFDTVSKKAWMEWLQNQTMLINEKQLNVIAPETQTYLAEQREKFLSNQPFDSADGYTPPASNE